jgi:hypothetical protein
MLTLRVLHPRHPRVAKLIAPSIYREKQGARWSGNRLPRIESRFRARVA